MREKRRLRVFKNGVLRRTREPKRDEVTWEWRRLYDEELHSLYSSPKIIRVIKSRRLRWAGHVAHTGASKGANRVLVGKPEERRSLRKPRSRWADNIKTDLQEVEWESMDRIYLAQDSHRWRAIENAVKNPWVP